MVEKTNEDIHDHNLIINQTKNWIDNVIIGHNYCPFARKVVEDNKVRFQVCQLTDTTRQLEYLVNECIYLDQHPETETTLIIFPSGLNHFYDYLDFLSLAEDMLMEKGYEGEYQLASFHPQYMFQGSEEDDPANYTNRSPYPMLHLIREASIEKVLKHFKNPEDIPERNIEFARAQGLDIMQGLLQASLKIKS